MERSPVLSSAQLKLCVLLIKASDLINFATDHECETVFAALAVFGKRLLLQEQHVAEERHKYQSMNLEALIAEAALGPGPGKRTLVPEPVPVQQARGAVANAPYKRAKAMAESEVGAAQPTVSTPFAGPVPVSRAGPDRARDSDSNQPLYWDFEASPNVVSILRFHSSPSSGLSIVFTARPALMGNHVPLTMYADMPKLLALARNDSSDKATSSRQSKNALRRLKKAIVAFAKATPLPWSLRKPLFALPWASKSFRSKVLFDQPDGDDGDDNDNGANDDDQDDNNE